MINFQDSFEVLTPDGWSDFDGISRKITNTVRIKLSNNTYIVSSFNHVFIINKKEIRASCVKPKMTLGGDTVVSISIYKNVATYDLLNVQAGNRYFHDNNIISHNCQFIGSSKQLLSASTMSRLTYDIPKYTYDGELAGLKIYTESEKDHIYTMTVDVSRGRHLDSSAFSVFDVTEYPHKIVATYKNNEVPPLMYAGICFNIANKYNEAYILVEINDIGSQVAEELYYAMEYENLYWSKSGDILGKKGADPYPGIRTTKKTKRIGCSNLKDIIDKQQLIINDADTITELSTFVQSDSGSWEADEGFHDDMVTTLWLFAWLVVQPWFVDLTDRSMRNKMYLSREQEIENSLTPFGFILDGRSNDIEEVNMVW